MNQSQFIHVLLNGFKYCLSNIDSFICTQLSGFKYCHLTLVCLFNVNAFKSSKWLNSSTWLKDGTLRSTSTQDQGESRSKDNERGTPHSPKPYHEMV